MKASSYKKILHATALLGGSQAINILAGLLRNKAVAWLVGTSGVGLASLYFSIAEMVRSLSGLGLEMSGMKEIATASQQGNARRTAYLVAHVRRLVRITALLGGIVCLLFSHPISLWALGSDAYQVQVMSVSVVVIFSTLQQGQMLVMQGLHHIAEVAKVTAWGNVATLLISLPLLYFFRTNGILPSLAIGTMAHYALSWFYYRSIHKSLFHSYLSVSWRETWQVGKALFRLGGYLVLGAMLSTVTMLAIRGFLVERMGMDAAGLFQAVWAITNVYLMLVLRVMGGDFYPRLCGVIHRRIAGERLINEQTYVALLIITPLIISILLFSPYILHLLYSSDFQQAASLLRWQALGAFLKVLSWPMAFVLLAKGKGKHYLFSELLFFSLYYGSTQYLFSHWGLLATGIGYVVSYVGYVLLVWLWARQFIRFRFHRNLVQEIFISVFLILFVFFTPFLDEHLPAYLSGGLILLISASRSFVKCRNMWHLQPLDA